MIHFLLRIGREGLQEMSAAAPPLATLEKVDKLCAAVRRRFLQRELKSYLVIRETLEGLKESSGNATTRTD